MKENLYIINSPTENCYVNFFNPKKLSIMEWHISLGHPSFTTMIHMQFLDKNELKDAASLIEGCDICAKAKQTRNPFSILNRRSHSSFELVHADIWGPYKEENVCSTKYMLTLVEDHSRLICIYLLSGKEQVADVLKAFIIMVKTQFHTDIKKFRTDNRSEFVNQVVYIIFVDHGILHHRSFTYTPQ